MKKAVASWMLFAFLAMTVVVLVFSSQPLQAQVDTGSITGTITDASSAVIGNAKVTLTNEGTSAALSTTADSGGVYTFNPVRIGSYSITVSYQGFQTTTQKNITVNVGSALTVNFALKPGQVTETVEVTTTTPLLETQTSSVGQVINQKSVESLP
ncbi:MAG TPA: carboxypeptidase-like regulatory domain-containing protein, partial [Terriglobales bacterium]